MWSIPVLKVSILRYIDLLSIGIENIETCLPQLFENLVSCMPLDSWLLHHDNAPVHRVFAAQEFLGGMIVQLLEHPALKKQYS